MAPTRHEPATSSAIDEALAEIRAGRMIILMDDEDRENEGDLCVAAERVTPEHINFMADPRRAASSACRSPRSRCDAARPRR